MELEKEKVIKRIKEAKEYGLNYSQLAREIGLQPITIYMFVNGTYNLSKRKQLQGIIQNSVSRTMNIKIPLQENTEDRNLLLQVLKAQVKIQEDIKRIQVSLSTMSSQINVLNHHHDYLVSNKRG